MSNKGKWKKQACACVSVAAWGWILCPCILPRVPASLHPAVHPCILLCPSVPPCICVSLCPANISPSCNAPMNPAMCPHSSAACSDTKPTRAPSLLQTFLPAVPPAVPHLLQPTVLICTLCCFTFQRLTLFAAWLHGAKVSGHRDKMRCWLPSELLFSSLKMQQIPVLQSMGQRLPALPPFCSMLLCSCVI